MRVAKADLVPTEANLRAATAASPSWRRRARRSASRSTPGSTGRPARCPASGWPIERARLHSLPAEPHALALGEERLVNDDQTMRFGSVRYSTPPGHGRAPRCGAGSSGERAGRSSRRTAARRAGRDRPAPRCPRPGNPQIVDEHYPAPPGRRTAPRTADGHGPAPRPRSRSWRLGDGAHAVAGRGGRGRGAAGAGEDGPRGRARRPGRRRARSTQPWGWPPTAGRFAEEDLPAILDHLRHRRRRRPTWSAPTRPTPPSPAPAAGRLGRPPGPPMPPASRHLDSARDDGLTGRSPADELTDAGRSTT